MASRNDDKPAAPLLFKAALSMRGKCFTLDSEGEASLLLQVPEQFARILSDNIHRLRDRSFIVQIDGLTAVEGRAKGKRRA